LLRVVAVTGGSKDAVADIGARGQAVVSTGDTGGDADPAGEHSDAAAADRVDIVPDPTRRRPGRGAHLHYDPACLAQAVRRRAFGRALRVTGVTDTGAVAAYLRDRMTDGEAVHASPRTAK